MGFWFFLTVIVVGNWVYKAYKLRVLSNANKPSNDRNLAMELELKAISEKVQALEEAVFFSDFDLKRQFSRLEHEMATKDKTEK